MCGNAGSALSYVSGLETARSHLKDLLYYVVAVICA